MPGGALPGGTLPPGYPLLLDMLPGVVPGPPPDTGVGMLPE